jgi:hypothetical protein
MARAMKVCAVPGCPDLTKPGKSYCQRHGRMSGPERREDERKLRSEREGRQRH